MEKAVRLKTAMRVEEGNDDGHFPQSCCCMPIVHDSAFIDTKLPHWRLHLQFYISLHCIPSLVTTGYMVFAEYCTMCFVSLKVNDIEWFNIHCIVLRY